ncbi:heme peroxidase [Ceraceosorus guamensis]|uniref:Peroxidase n=1 Tax=Ceraceosorus guamensis TaxID=1522189 RepID=A0A316W629_9BASI|nr:heme peroxidase [Ceraceosorus guamensis]PWN45376.1 heme peroxidase [Ceraceosorus guamensis]
MSAQVIHPSKLKSPYTQEQVAAVKKDVEAILKNKDYDDGSIGPVLVRLAWHSSGTYCAETKTGGSNGAGMRYEKEGGDPANAGLQHARVFLEPIKEKHSWITYADLWTLAGVVAIKAMGGPEIEWYPGRTDFVDDARVPPRGRLPDAAQAQDHLRAIFYRMGFNDQEIVALSGAHNLGRCHADRSGFEGPWVNNPTRFSNQYYKMLIKLKWEKKHLGREAQGAHWQWIARLPHMDEEDEPLMMLPTDMSLTLDDKFKPWVEKYAEDQDLFFKDFAAVFGKLIELGVTRDESGLAQHDGKAGEYKSAPKKSDSLEGPKSKL